MKLDIANKLSKSSRLQKSNGTTKQILFSTITMMLLSPFGFSQQLSVEFSSNAVSNDYDTLTVYNLPEIDFPLLAEDAVYSVQYELGSTRLMSGEWLLQKQSNLTKEEYFAKEWFMKVFKNPYDIQGMIEVLDEEYFNTISERNANGDFPTDFELTEAELYSDIRLLGLSRYGNQYILFADLQPIDQGEASGFVMYTTMVNGKYRLKGNFDNATISLLFGLIPLEIRRALRERLGIDLSIRP